MGEPQLAALSFKKNKDMDDELYLYKQLQPKKLFDDYNKLTNSHINKELIRKQVGGAAVRRVVSGASE